MSHHRAEGIALLPPRSELLLAVGVIGFALASTVFAVLAYSSMAPLWPTWAFFFALLVCLAVSSALRSARSLSGRH